MNTKLLKQKILDLAIHGRLVPQNPDDEPASQLLRRISEEKEKLIAQGKIKRPKKSDAVNPAQECPFEIPNSWECEKLCDIAYVGTGATPDTKNKDYYNGDIPWVNSSLTKNDFIEIPTTFITHKAINETNCQLYPKGTLVMAMYGEGKTRGQISELQIDAAINQACAAIVPYDLSTKNYIKLFLKSRYLHIREMAEGGTQPNLNLTKIAQYFIPLPPLAEQQRIVSAIEKWFSLIDEIETNKESLQAAIKQTKSKVLDLAIKGKLVSQDINDEPASELLKRINKEKENLINQGKIKRPKKSDAVNAIQEFPFEIPDSWEWVKLGEIAQSELGKTLDKGKNTGTPYNYLCALNVKWNSFDFRTLKQILLEDSEKERYLVRRGDLLICEGGDVGRAAIWNSDDDIYYQNALHRVRFYGDINQYFYLFALQYYKIQGWIDGVSAGVTIKHFTQNSMQKLYFPLPPLSEQTRIVSKIEEVFALLDEIERELA